MGGAGGSLTISIKNPSLLLEKHSNITLGQNTLTTLTNLICSILLTIRQLILKNVENANILRNLNNAIHKIYNIADTNLTHNNFPVECSRAAAQLLCSLWALKDLRVWFRRDGWNESHFLHADLLNKNIPNDVTIMLNLSNLLDKSKTNIEFDEHHLLTKSVAANKNSQNLNLTYSNKSTIKKDLNNNDLIQSGSKIIKNLLPSQKKELDRESNYSQSQSQLPESIGASTLSFHGLGGNVYRNWSLRSRKNIENRTLREPNLQISSPLSISKVLNSRVNPEKRQQNESPIACTIEKPLNTSYQNIQHMQKLTFGTVNAPSPIHYDTILEKSNPNLESPSWGIAVNQKINPMKYESSTMKEMKSSAQNASHPINFEPHTFPKKNYAQVSPMTRVSNQKSSSLQNDEMVIDVGLNHSGSNLKSEELHVNGKHGNSSEIYYGLRLLRNGTK